MKSEKKNQKIIAKMKKSNICRNIANFKSRKGKDEIV